MRAGARLGGGKHGHLRGALRAAALAAVPVLLAWAFLAPSAAAQTAWDGAGTLSMSSTPSEYGACTGSGSSQLSIAGEPSDLEGTITLDLESVSSICESYFTIGPVSANVTGYLDQGTLYLTDSYGDSFTGSFSGGDLSLTWSSVQSAGDGAVCVEFCTTIYTMQMSGTGDLGIGTGSNATGLFNSTSPALPVAATGAAVGFAGLGVGLSSLPGRGPRTGRSPGGLQGLAGGDFHVGGGARMGTIQTLGPTYGPAPVSTVGNPPPPISGPDPSAGQPITGGGAGTTGGALAPPPNDICSFISVNGVPLNPNWGDKAVVRINPATGRAQYYDQHTGEWFWAFPGS